MHDPERRAQRRCALPGFGEHLWISGRSEQCHMGGPRIWEPKDLLRFKRAGGRDPKTPPEPNEDGCPGAWYRCAFAESVSRYERTIMRDAIASNPLLDRCDDPLVLESVAHLEHERLRHRNHWNDRFGAK